MKVIIAGSRGINSTQALEEAIDMSGFQISEVVSGHCEDSPDMTGELWGHACGITVTTFPADWNDIAVAGAVIRTRNDGSKYNAAAGYLRNEKMAQYADALIAIWDGKSGGTKDMIKRMRERGKKTFVVQVDT